MTDRDLELLDGYLDGALSDAELREAEQRLETDVLFIGALARLRSDRELRSQVWQSMQVDDGAADRVMDRIDEALSRRESWAGRLRTLRYLSAAAAVILVCFMGDVWLQRHGQVNLPTGAVNGDMTVQPKSSGPHQQYQVILKDGSGRVIGVQQFDSLEKARLFEEDMNKWQERHLDMQNSAQPSADKF
jgi:anti-sigma factor RsiW